MVKVATSDSTNLMEWYRHNRRVLPWRQDRDPYRIWLSEVMLQQTTVVAVIPYYERFLKRFPNLKSLATAKVEDAVEYWAGLGYYSRARNLHKAAQELHKRGGFPQTAAELIELPGFGPYTSRAVASLAFDEKVGVLDGNVIRILSRRYGLAVEWWKPAGRDQLQNIADQLAQVATPSDLNQGMMELGATVCTPQSPACILCPWQKVCVARHEGKIFELPLKKPRRAREIWVWKPRVIEKRGKIALIENSYAPFLRGHWICPGTAFKKDIAPKKYDYKGTVTHHDIFVCLDREHEVLGQAEAVKWVATSDLKGIVPTSLIRKAIEKRLSELTED